MDACTCRWVCGLVWGLGGFVWAGWVTGWVGTCRWVCGLVCDWVNITMLMGVWAGLVIGWVDGYK